MDTLRETLIWVKTTSEAIVIPPTLAWPFKFCLSVSVAVFVASILTANVSQVDRLWTFLPPIYIAYFALLPLWPQVSSGSILPFAPVEIPAFAREEISPRALLMLGLAVLWMFRLSYNTYRRGLFNLQDEDYRWAVLRAQLHPILFQLVNISFIASTQNVLLLLLGLPARDAILATPRDPLGLSDAVLSALALLILVLEFISDNQQYSFQTFKYGKGTYDPKAQWPGSRLDWNEEDAKRGFVTKGLWAWSRHPNFACEQSFWWVITLFPLLTPSSTFIQSLIKRSQTFVLFQSPITELDVLLPLLPALALSTLFFASTTYTENITAKKYKAYEDYQERVGFFSPITTLVQAAFLTMGGRKAAIDAVLWGKEKNAKGKSE